MKLQVHQILFNGLYIISIVMSIVYIYKLSNKYSFFLNWCLELILFINIFSVGVVRLDGWGAGGGSGFGLLPPRCGRAQSGGSQWPVPRLTQSPKAEGNEAGGTRKVRQMYNYSSINVICVKPAYHRNNCNFKWLAV